MSYCPLARRTGELSSMKLRDCGRARSGKQRKLVEVRADQLRVGDPVAELGRHCLFFMLRQKRLNAGINFQKD